MKLKQPGRQKLERQDSYFNLLMGVDSTDFQQMGPRIRHLQCSIMDRHHTVIVIHHSIRSKRTEGVRNRRRTAMTTMIMTRGL